MYILILLECVCNKDGSNNAFCDDDGKCTCKGNYGGDKCDQCKEGFTGPNCEKGNFLHLIKLSSHHVI